MKTIYQILADTEFWLSSMTELGVLDEMHGVRDEAKRHAADIARARDALPLSAAILKVDKT